jgi:hypothetical protein
MGARDEQARGIADKLVQLSLVHNLPPVIMGRAFKPDVTSDEGSSSVLTGYYVERAIESMGDFCDFKLEYDTIGEPAVYLLAHKGKFNDLRFPPGSVILDVWREFPPQDDVKIYYYGSYKN